jgi:hypothetical protein
MGRSSQKWTVAEAQSWLAQGVGGVGEASGEGRGVRVAPAVGDGALGSVEVSSSAAAGLGKAVGGAIGAGVVGVMMTPGRVGVGGPRAAARLAGSEQAERRRVRLRRARAKGNFGLRISECGFGG